MDNIKTFGIIESGSNSNGNYIKFSDGTMIEYGSATISTNNSSGGIFPYLGGSYITFPTQFLNSPVCFSNIYEDSAYWNSSVTNVSPSQANLAVSGDRNNTSHIVMWLAVGKWK